MSLGTRWSCGIAVLALTAWCGPALAWTAEVSWPTFYRAGPDKQYAVLEELSRGSMLEVLSCENDWCRVRNGRTLGFVERSALLTPSALPGKPAVPPVTTGCFVSRQAGYGSGEQFRYCSRPAG